MSYQQYRCTNCGARIIQLRGYCFRCKWMEKKEDNDARP